MTWLARCRGQIQVVVDVLAWLVAIFLANAFRYDFDGKQLLTAPLLSWSLGAALLQLGVGVGCHLYRGRYRFGSFEEVEGVIVAVGMTTTVFLAVNVALPSLPRTVPIAAGVLAFVLMVGARSMWRLFLNRRRTATSDSVRLLLFGAGEGAEQALSAIRHDPTGRYLAVGLLDDDPRKRNLRLRGVPVLGTRRDLERVAAKTGARTLLLAVPSADASLVRDLSDLAAIAGLEVKILPTVRDLLDGRVGVGDIRDVNLSDILGRRQIDLDVASIAGYLTGKRVLVTGAGGSIGSELCHQISLFAPAELIMLDRDESALHAVQLALNGRAMLDGDDLVLADIRDIEHLQRIFQKRRPQVVFHAAALKHLTLLERFPGESVKSNVWGTLSVLEAARDAGVEHFVNISTDKAADPTSVLGYSKRIAERLTAHVAQEASGCFLSVRFGNVLGSRGSVLTAFSSQVQAGGPLTVTHPDVTRYFMTVSEAVQLVVQAGAAASTGDVFVLDMGRPVRIADVARRMAESAPRPVEIVYTGLRPGEKLHEDLLGRDEADERPWHPLISQVAVPAIRPLQALELDPWLPSKDVVVALRDLAYSPTRDDDRHGAEDLVSSPQIAQGSMS
ncbi:MAG: polysaccharide biosynthesis protein [Actinomycetota bacterium]|nr:polysaccharide biosynthesis protein [Actinomycetota bacterium]